MRNRTELPVSDFKSTWDVEFDGDPVPEAFKYFDPTNTGSVDFEVVRRLYKDLGYGTIPNCELATIIKRMDLDHDGTVSFVDFKSMLQPS